MREGTGSSSGAWVVLAVALASGHAAGAGPPDPEIPVPVDVQASLLRRILPFERRLASRAKGEVRIGVLYQELWRHSAAAKDVFVAAASGNGPGTRPTFTVTCVPVPLTDAAALRDAVERERIDVLYVAPIRAFDASTIAEIARSKRILTAAALPELVVQGLTLGFKSRGGKPVILVNRSAARAEGADFESRLLDLAEVIP